MVPGVPSPAFACVCRKVTYTQDRHMFHILVQDGLTFLCMAEDVRSLLSRDPSLYSASCSIGSTDYKCSCGLHVGRYLLLGNHMICIPDDHNAWSRTATELLTCSAFDCCCASLQAEGSLLLFWKTSGLDLRASMETPGARWGHAYMPAGGC
jgi:hypothetical protein